MNDMKATVARRRTVWRLAARRWRAKAQAARGRAMRAGGQVARLAAALALGCAAAAAAPERLNVLGWRDYVEPATLESFAAQTGVDVVYDSYDDEAAMEARLRRPGDYDVVIVPAARLADLAAAGLLRPLDLAAIPNAAGLDAAILAKLAVLDPGRRHGLPYLWFATGLAFDAARIDPAKPDTIRPDAIRPDGAKSPGGASGVLSAGAPAGAPAAGAFSPGAFPAAAPAGDPAVSWDLALRPDKLARFADCGVSSPDAPEALFALALRQLRLDPSSTRPLDLRRAADLLAPLRRAAQRTKGDDVEAGLASGEICLAVTTSLTAARAARRAREGESGADIRFVVPREGAPILIDALAVPAAARRPQTAFAFINYLLRPQTAARATNATRLANAAPASRQWIARDVAADQTIYPPPEASARLFAAPTPDAAGRQAMAREWARTAAGR
ncbi:extracellular solute-binding protein [Methylocella sp.]|uniref:extracellular solute-binding protein n=1 Tax=Methylocella sp. TaxID=1978226 RepID=UPI0037836B8A